MVWSGCEEWWRRGRVELPVQKRLSGTYYKLSRLFYLARPTPTDRVGPDQPVNLSPLLPALKRRHPHFSAPNPDPSGWGQVRWQPVLLGCNHYWFGVCFFAALFRRLQRLRLQSCNAPPLSKPRVPMYLNAQRTVYSPKYIIPYGVSSKCRIASV